MKRIDTLKELARSKARAGVWFPVDANTIRFTQTRPTPSYMLTHWPEVTYKQHVFLQFTDTKVFREIRRAPWVNSRAQLISLKTALETLERPDMVF